MADLPTPREGPSPFLEGTAIQFAWDSTSLGSFKRCSRKYQLEIIEGWRPKDTNVHLFFGLRYTEALDRYDKAKAAAGEGFDHESNLMWVVELALTDTWIDPNVRGECDCCNKVAVLRRAEVTGIETFACAECHGYASDEFDEPSGPWESGRTDKNRFNLIRTIVWYLDQFKDDPAETVIDEKGQPLCERSFRLELDWGPYGLPQPYLLCGHLDKVVSFLGGQYVLDHKTTKSTIGDYYFDQFEPNNQMSLYTIAAKVIFNTPVSGVIIDAAQIAVGFSRFARGMTYRTEAQTEEWITDLRQWLILAETYAIAGYWPMNDTVCFGCPFNNHDAKICAKDPAVRESFLRSSFEKDNPWNPLKVRN